MKASNIFLIWIPIITSVACSPDIGENHYYQPDPPPGSQGSATGGASSTTGGSAATGGSKADTGGQEATGGDVQIIMN